MSAIGSTQTVRGADAFNAAGFAYADVRAFGAGHVFTKAASGGLGESGAPMFEPSAEGRRGVASASRFMNREQLADALADSNASLGNSLSGSMVDAIRGEGVFVIAGQQPGLLGGPMMAMLKAVTAVRMAEELSKRWPVPVLPAFWIASEDHDLGEVNRCWLGGEKVVADHPQLHVAGCTPPVGTVSLEGHRERVVEAARERLSGLPGYEEAIEKIGSLNYENYASHFASVITGLLGEGRVVLVDPMRLRGLFAGVMAEAVDRWSDLEVAFEEGRGRLQTAGFEPPLSKLTLFEIDSEHGRRAVPDVSASSGKDVLAAPERYSPSAGLRPIVQDAVLPVAATVGGPAELLYLWQVDPLADVLLEKRGGIWPRMSATFVDDKTVSLGARFGLDGLGLLNADPDESPLGEASLGANSADLDRIAELAGWLDEAIGGLPEHESEKVVKKARESIAHQAGKAVDRARQLRLEKQGVGRKRMQRIADFIRPGGAAQERTVSPFDLLARMGPGVFDTLLTGGNPFELLHLMIRSGEAGDAAVAHELKERIE